MTKINPLKKTFIGKGDVKGFNYMQIDRGGKAAIYQVNIPNCNHTTYYDVFKIKTSNITWDKNGKIVKTNTLSELYPKANAYGKYAFQFSNLNHAINKFKTLK